MEGFQPAHSRCKASGTEFSNNCVIWLEALFCPRNPPRWEGSGWSILFTGEQIAKGPGSDLTTGSLWRGQVTTWQLCLSLFPCSVSHMVLLMSQREQLLSSAYNSYVWTLQSDSCSHSVKHAKKKEKVPLLHGKVTIEQKRIILECFRRTDAQRNKPDAERQTRHNRTNMWDLKQTNLWKQSRVVAARGWGMGVKVRYWSKGAEVQLCRISSGI